VRCAGLTEFSPSAIFTGGFGPFPDQGCRWNCGVPSLIRIWKEKSISESHVGRVVTRTSKAGAEESNIVK